MEEAIEELQEMLMTLLPIGQWYDHSKLIRCAK
jgi:hypothetical protein